MKRVVVMMKKLTVLMLVVVMVLGLMSIVVGARGPANRATGLVWLEGDGDIRVEFDAHVEEGTRPVKGTVYWYRFGVLRVELDVICCNVVGNTAWFATVPTYLDPGVDPIYEDQFLFFKVVDGGSPGTNGDAFSVEWVPVETDARDMVENEDDPSGGYTIIGGNLVVHYYAAE